MSYNAENTYDAHQKIWSGRKDRNFFAPDLSIGEIIFHEMRRHPNLIALISHSENTVLTREELQLNSMRVASYMRSLGLQQSDIVGIIARNTTHIFAVAYGCFFNGVAFHSLNVNYEQSTIEKLFDLTKPRLIFCDGEDYEKVKIATEKLNVKIITMRNHQEGSISIEEVLATPVEKDFEPARLEQGVNQTLAILCTSGTTGIPKAVTITNSQKLLNASPFRTTADVQFGLGTLDWVSGLQSTVLSGVYSTKRVICDKPFDPVRFLNIIEEHKVTLTVLAPYHMSMMVNCPEFKKTDLNSIRSLLYGGGCFSLEIQHRLRKRLRHDCLHLAYSFSEANSLVAINHHFDEKPNSSGQLNDGYKLKILNDQGETLGPNEVGELCVCSGQYWGGYYGNSEETRKILDSELWFHTGDLGYMDNDSFLYIVDRKKDTLRYRNVMYHPYEIEEVISQMPGVAEVCVFGIWDEINGDEAAAAVVKKNGSDIKAQDVVDYVKEHSTAIYKHLPAGAIIVDELKHSPNGKTNRKATKAYFLQLNGKK